MWIVMWLRSLEGARLSLLFFSGWRRKFSGRACRGGCAVKSAGQIVKVSGSERGYWWWTTEEEAGSKISWNWSLPWCSGRGRRFGWFSGSGSGRANPMMKWGSTARENLSILLFDTFTSPQLIRLSTIIIRMRSINRIQEHSIIIHRYSALWVYCILEFGLFDLASPQWYHAKYFLQ